MKLKKKVMKKKKKKNSNPKLVFTFWGVKEVDEGLEKKKRCVFNV